MDGTIIKTKSGAMSTTKSGAISNTISGNTFPSNERDWIFFNPLVPPTLRRLHATGHTLVIFSNQGMPPLTFTTAFPFLTQSPGGFSKSNPFTGRGKATMSKIDSFIAQLQLPLTVYLATARDGNRKPAAGMLSLFNSFRGSEQLHPDSFFCGDAAGRANDHSADDRGFAAAAGLKFVVPEEVFTEEL
jgi:bifunctional polynucleotide phosphatase/kinase